MKKIIVWGSLVITIGCANVVTQPTSLPTVNKEVVSNAPTPNVNPTINHGSIAIHVISGANGRAIAGVEISANGNYFGSTDSGGNFNVDLQYDLTYDFTIYHGEYAPSHEKHTFDKNNNSFTSMLTSIR